MIRRPDLPAPWDEQPQSLDAAMAALTPTLIRMADCLARGEADLLDELVQTGQIKLWRLWESPYQLPSNVAAYVWRAMLHARRWELRRRYESLDAMEDAGERRNREREEEEAA